jgi:hypothetical protein
MRSWLIACLCIAVLAPAGTAAAGDSRTYDRPIEMVWDEAVKAIRDADLVLSDSKRAEHWFTMKTQARALTRNTHFEVELTQAGDRTTVRVRSTDEEGSKKSIKVIARYLDALDARLD